MSTVACEPGGSSNDLDLMLKHLDVFSEFIFAQAFFISSKHRVATTASGAEDIEVNLIEALVMADGHNDVINNDRGIRTLVVSIDNQQKLIYLDILLIISFKQLDGGTRKQFFCGVYQHDISPLATKMLNNILFFSTPTNTSHQKNKPQKQNKHSHITITYTHITLTNRNDIASGAGG